MYEQIAERLKERGWAKTMFGPPEGPNCLLGALKAVTARGTYLQVQPQILNLYEVIQEQYPDRVPAAYKDVPGGAMACFNDDPSTTLEDILLVLDKAARKAEEKV